MASRDIGGSIQAALRDLFDERAVVEDAIDKLQSLLENMKESVSGVRRGRPPGSGHKTKAAVAGKKGTKEAGKKVTKKASKKKAGKKATKKASWTGTARKEAAARMKKYWADRKKKDGATKGRRKKNA